MRHLLNKSGILILFFTVIYTVLLLGLNLLNYRNSLTSTDSSGMNDNADDYRLIIEALILLSTLILLNIWSIMGFWLESKKSEVFIRRLCGASNEAVMKKIMLDYWLLISISFIMSLILVWLIGKSDVMPFQYLFIYVIVLIVGIILGMHSILRFTRKELVDLR